MYSLSIFGGDFCVMVSGIGTVFAAHFTTNDVINEYTFF